VATVYLENDDEITTAIGRIRAVGERDAIVVVPPGSKIATSRINFKLLAREAATRRMNVVAVSDEPQVRALAISAGLPAYDSIATAQQALATFSDQDRQLAKRIDRTMPREHPAPAPRSDQTQVLPPSVVARSANPAGANALGDTAVLPAPPPAAPRTGRRQRRLSLAPLLVLAFALLLIIAVGYGAYLYLPSATVTVRPALAQVVSPSFVVTADPTVAVVDVAHRTIPAQHLIVPVHADGSFAATGIEARDIKATGSVRFRSENTLNDVTIPAGTVVATADDVEFATVADTIVPKASFATGPTTVNADVHALKGGTKGNVDAGTIVLVPAPFASELITVTNPDATSGGKHVEDQVVTQDDYDNALNSLSAQLQTALSAALADPANVPRGLMAFAQTAQLSAGQPDQTADALVGVAMTSFALGLDATADVIAVNESLIDQLADTDFRQSVPSASHVLGNVAAVHDAGTVVGSTVVYRVAETAYVYATPSTKDVLDRVAGKSISEARAALAYAGEADIAVWPDFVGNLPQQGGRISVSVVAPTAAPSLAPATLTPATVAPGSAQP
jgi:baseplate J-like protein